MPKLNPLGPRLPGATSKVVSAASRGPLARAAAKSLVAGESIDDAIRVTGELAERGLRVSWLPLLKEAASADDLLTVQAETIGALGWLAAAGTTAPDLTIDLAIFGVFADDVSAGVLINSLREVGQAARNAGVTLTLSVSDPRYMQAVSVLSEELRQDFPEVGVVLPTRLRRAPEDLDDLATPGRRVRLTTDRLDAALGMTSARESGTAFVEVAKKLVEHGSVVGFDTDDALLLDIATSLVQRAETPDENSTGASSEATTSTAAPATTAPRAEIVSPLGVSIGKRDDALPRRVIVPYGEQWSAYVARMLGARPSLTLSLPNPVRRRS